MITNLELYLDTLNVYLFNNQYEIYLLFYTYNFIYFSMDFYILEYIIKNKNSRFQKLMTISDILPESSLLLLWSFPVSFLRLLPITIIIIILEKSQILLFDLILLFYYYIGISSFSFWSNIIILLFFYLLLLYWFYYYFT